MPAHSVGSGPSSAHRTRVRSGWPCRDACQEDQLRASVMRQRQGSSSLSMADGDDAARHHVREVLERRLLDRALLRGKEDVLALFFKVAHRRMARTFSPCCRSSRLCMDLPLPAHPRRELRTPWSSHAAGVGKAEQVGVGRVDDERRDQSLLRGLMPHASEPPRPLRAIDRDRRPLQVALVAHRPATCSVGDQIFTLQHDSARLAHNGWGATRASPYLSRTSSSSFTITAAQLDVAGQDQTRTRNPLTHLASFGQQLVDGEFASAGRVAVRRIASIVPERQPFLRAATGAVEVMTISLPLPTHTGFREPRPWSPKSE